MGIINENLQWEMDNYYRKLNEKLERLQAQHNASTPKPKEQQPTSFPHTINLTNIQFTDEERKLLDLGLQYSMEKPTKATWENLVIETERAIRLLDNKLQNPFRIMATKKLKQLHNTKHQNATHKRQWYVMKQINHKITSNKAMIAKADKGKTAVIIYTQDYTDKVHMFLSDNNFHTVPKDPTNHDHRTIQKTLQHCDKIIDKKQIKFLTQKNPTPHTLNALLKLHTPNTLIRPVVDNKNAPTHKTARRLNTILNNHVHLDKRYITINSNTLANELVNLKINSRHRLFTLNIKDLFVNILIQETLNLTRTQLNAHNDKQTTHQIMTLLNTILRQNYFSFLGQIYQPDKGVTMDLPISGTMAEIFLQLENSIIKHLIDAKILSFYTRYVDDILLIYDSTHTFSSSSALQLFVNFGLLNYSSPWFPFLCLMFPIIYSHLPQIISHVIIPS